MMMKSSGFGCFFIDSMLFFSHPFASSCVPDVEMEIAYSGFRCTGGMVHHCSPLAVVGMEASSEFHSDVDSLL